MTSTVSEAFAESVRKRKGLRRFDPSLVGDIVAFQKAAYPHRRKDWIEPRLRWMYLESARRLGVEPMMWMYHDGERIAAYQGGIPVRLKVGHRELTTGWFVETMALESARGRTVGPAVIMKAAEDLPFNLSLGQTQAMRELQYRLGWTKVAELQTAQFLIDPAAVLRDKLRVPIVAKAVGAAMQVRSRVRRLHSSCLDGFTTEIIDRFDERHDRLWNRVQSDLKCAVVRDAGYLNWKYVDQPGQEFHRLELCDGNGTAAVAVLSFAEPKGDYRYRRAFLVDLLVPLNDERTLKALLETVRRYSVARSADAIICHHINRRITGALRKVGYLLRQPTRYLLVRPGQIEEDIRKDVIDPDRWFVTMGDSDIDRPW